MKKSHTVADAWREMSGLCAGSGSKSELCRMKNNASARAWDACMSLFQHTRRSFLSVAGTVACDPMQKGHTSQSKNSWYAHCSLDRTSTTKQEADMNWEQAKGNWKQVKGKVKEQWGKLTDDELDEIEGRRDQLLGKIQKQYGITKEEAERQVGKWEREL
jgi:uncharacterized protein YjbJ (UPF0337 family)